MLNKIGKVIKNIYIGILIIIFLPFEIIIFIFALVFMQTTERSFKFLKKIGYKHSRKKQYSYYTKGNLTFRIQQDRSYMVKYGDNEYVDLHNFTIGSDYEKRQLQDKLLEYESAHVVDKQRGEIDTLTTFSEFIERHIKDFEDLARF